MTEREKMEKGLWYDANYDTELVEKRLEAEELCFAFNHTRPKEVDQKEALLKKILPHKGAGVVILSPFYTDYGYNCWIGEATFINHNAYLMDGAPIVIGTHCFIGPNCGMYTANHPVVAEERNMGLEQAKPITIGDHVWVGGHHWRRKCDWSQECCDQRYSSTRACCRQSMPRSSPNHRG